jgi:hypothetical protein
MRSPSSR